MLPRGTSFEEIESRFSWQVPTRYNIGVDVCDKWAAHQANRSALVFESADGKVKELSFGELRDQSNQLCNWLVSKGIGKGDRVAILLPQSMETALAHIAVYKVGAIAVPLFKLFGPEALQYRLADSGTSLVITDSEGAEKLGPIKNQLPNLKLIATTEPVNSQIFDLSAELDNHDKNFEPVDTVAEDPALIIYTSGTTGPPKGALHAHRVLLGHLPGVEISHDLFPQTGDRVWTPADWAWIGGLLDVLLPALHHGITVVARRFDKFDPLEALAFMARHRIRNAFLPPTALKMMRRVDVNKIPRDLDLRTIASGGETLGIELINWAREVFGLTINEFYGQTECNMIVSSCSAVMEARPGIMGRPVPGHRLAVIDDNGNELEEGEIGHIAVSRLDPVMFLGYWNNARASEKKFIGDWLVTGDQGTWESDGWLRFVGREDDVITSSGYRIGPGEIEDCLIRHPAIQMAGVVGEPDPERTEAIVAFLVLNEGFEPTKVLEEEIKAFVRTNLAAHEYPRKIRFVSSLPLTTTGKIIRNELRAQL